VANLDKYDHFIKFLSLFTFYLLTNFCHAYLVIHNFLSQICMDFLTITKIKVSIGIVEEFKYQEILYKQEYSNIIIHKLM